MTLLDIDGPKNGQRAKRLPSEAEIAAVGRIVQNEPIAVSYERSPSGGGWHVTVIWRDEMTDMEIIAMQAVLGSDLRRETMNLGRVRSGKQDQYWNLLYRENLTNGSKEKRRGGRSSAGDS